MYSYDMPCSYVCKSVGITQSFLTIHIVAFISTNVDFVTDAICNTTN